MAEALLANMTEQPGSFRRLRRSSQVDSVTSSSSSAGACPPGVAVPGLAKARSRSAMSFPRGEQQILTPTMPHSARRERGGSLLKAQLGKKEDPVPCKRPGVVRQWSATSDSTGGASGFSLFGGTWSNTSSFGGDEPDVHNVTPTVRFEDEVEVFNDTASTATSSRLPLRSPRNSQATPRAPFPGVPKAPQCSYEGPAKPAAPAAPAQLPQPSPLQVVRQVSDPLQNSWRGSSVSGISARGSSVSVLSAAAAAPCPAGQQRRRLPAAVPGLLGLGAAGQEPPLLTPLGASPGSPALLPPRRTSETKLPVELCRRPSDPLLSLRLPVGARCEVPAAHIVSPSSSVCLRYPATAAAVATATAGAVAHAAVAYGKQLLLPSWAPPMLQRPLFQNIPAKEPVLDENYEEHLARIRKANSIAIREMEKLIKAMMPKDARAIGDGKMDVTPLRVLEQRLESLEDSLGSPEASVPATPESKDGQDEEETDPCIVLRGLWAQLGA